MVPLRADEDGAAGESDEGDGCGVCDAERPPAEGDGAAGERAERAGRQRLPSVERRAERAVEGVGERQVLQLIDRVKFSTHSFIQDILTT